MADLSKATYSVQIAAAIENYLNDKEWKFMPTDEHGVIRTGLKLRNKLKSVDIFFRVGRENFTVTLRLPIGAGEELEDLNRVNEFITRANYGMRRGCFEMDFRDGEINFRAGQYCDGAPNPEAVEDTLFVAVAMVERYGDALLKVIHGFATPEEAIDEAEA